MTEPRIIPPEEARPMSLLPAFTESEAYVRDLAHTAAVLGEQRKAVLALHVPVPWVTNNERGAGCSGCDWDYYPCPTARAIGVTE